MALQGWGRAQGAGARVQRGAQRSARSPMPSTLWTLRHTGDSIFDRYMCSRVALHDFGGAKSVATWRMAFLRLQSRRRRFVAACCGVAPRVSFLPAAMRLVAGGARACRGRSPRLRTRLREVHFSSRGPTLRPAKCFGTTSRRFKNTLRGPLPSLELSLGLGWLCTVSCLLMWLAVLLRL